MKIIPAIDIIDGKCVRLTQGDYDRKKIYNEDPLEVAKQFEDAGLRRLHLVDLDGARASRIINYRTLERIATHTHLLIDFGGGLKSDEDLRIAFESGARQVTGGTIAVEEPDLFLRWLTRYGPEHIILGADVRDGHIAVRGWQEKSDQELFPFIENFHEQGVRYVICTEVSRDGLLQGSAVQLYQDILDRFGDIRLIASGGVSSMSEIEALEKIGCYGVILGKAIYEQRITLKELTDYVSEQ